MNKISANIAFDRCHREIAAVFRISGELMPNLARSPSIWTTLNRDGVAAFDGVDGVPRGPALDGVPPEKKEFCERSGKNSSCVLTGLPPADPDADSCLGYHGCPDKLGSDFAHTFRSTTLHSA